MNIKSIQRALAALFVVGFLAACGGDASETDAGREIELTPVPADGEIADQAQTPPVADATAPATKAPATTPRPATPRPAAPAAPTSGAVAAGTTMQLAAGARICTNTHKEGDRFMATIRQDITGTNGAVIPAGSEVTLEVVESVRGENSADKIKLAFRPVSIAVRGDVVMLAGNVTQTGRIEAVRVQSTRTQAEKVAVGAVAGAVAGQLLGRDTKSTVAGAAVGAAAGGAVAAATTDYNGCLAADGLIAVTLTEAVQVRV